MPQHYGPNMNRLVSSQKHFLQGKGASPTNTATGLLQQQQQRNSQMKQRAAGSDRGDQLGIDVPMLKVPTPPPLPAGFRPTLEEGLESGFRADTTVASKAAIAALDQTLGKTLEQITEAMASKGLTGSSAQSQQFSTAGSEAGVSLADRLAQLEIAADEAASGRRVAALQAGLGQADVANVARGLDISQAEFGLQSRTQEAIAKQNMLNYLLSREVETDPSIAGRRYADIQAIGSKAREGELTGALQRLLSRAQEARSSEQWKERVPDRERFRESIAEADRGRRQQLLLARWGAPAYPTSINWNTSNFAQNVIQPGGKTAGQEAATMADILEAQRALAVGGSS